MDNLSDNIQQALNAVQIAIGSDEDCDNPIQSRYVVICRSYLEKSLEDLKRIQGDKFVPFFGDES